MELDIAMILAVALAVLIGLHLRFRIDQTQHSASKAGTSGVSSKQAGPQGSPQTKAGAVTGTQRHV
jgi:hypothetical protein